MFRRGSLGILFIALLFVPACGDDASPTPDTGVVVDIGSDAALTGTIAGVVKDKASGAAIAGAKVTTLPATVEATTDSQGTYSLAVPAGDYEVEAQATGYDSAKSASTTVAVGQTVTLDLELVATVTYNSTCESCHLRREQLEASLLADPLPPPPGEGGSTGEG